MRAFQVPMKCKREALRPWHDAIRNVVVEWSSNTYTRKAVVSRYTSVQPQGKYIKHDGKGQRQKAHLKKVPTKLGSSLEERGGPRSRSHCARLAAATCCAERRLPASPGPFPCGATLGCGGGWTAFGNAAGEVACTAC